MKKILVFVTSVFFLSSCLLTPKEKKKDETNPEYLAIFIGTYTIEVDGMSSEKSVEVYTLNKNGQATWQWVYKNTNGTEKVNDEKSGTWKASKAGVTIFIKGNSGMIDETYEYDQDSILRNTLLTKRHLKRKN